MKKPASDPPTFTPPTAGPQQLLGKTLANDKDLVTSLVDSDAWRFHQCRNVFKFLYGRSENQCEAKTFDACVEALSSAKTIQSAVAAVAKDPRSAASEENARDPPTLCLLAVLAAIGASASACSEEADSLTGGNGPGGPGGANPDDPSATPADLQCTQKPAGRSYVLFDGQKLEDARVNENVGINRARLKPFNVLQGEYQRVLGLVPASLAASAGSFDEPPARWYAEAQHSGSR